MRVISRKRLQEFWESDPRFLDSQAALIAWHAEAERAQWTCFADIKAFHAKASLIGNSRACFNVCNNKYRLIVAIDYNHGIVLVKWIGTHKEYDRIDAATIGGI